MLKTKLPNTTILVPKNRACKFSKPSLWREQCPWRQGCRGAVATAVRNNPFVCDLKTMKQWYANELDNRSTNNTNPIVNLQRVRRKLFSRFRRAA